MARTETHHQDYRTSVVTKKNNKGIRYEPVRSKPIAMSKGATAPASVKIAKMEQWGLLETKPERILMRFRRRTG